MRAPDAPTDQDRRPHGAIERPRVQASESEATFRAEHDGGEALAAPADVELLGVTKRFGRVVAVDDLDLRIARGAFYSLLGPSGCGKTTTLRMIAGFDQPSEGEVLIAGQPVAGVPPYRRNVNTVFQHYALFPHLMVTVTALLLVGLVYRRQARQNRAGDDPDQAISLPEAEEPG